jgi:DNA-binding beta-propeller fold protein YncE
MRYNSKLIPLLSVLKLRGAQESSRAAPRSRIGHRQRLIVEALEDRRLLSSGVHDVLDIGDNGDNSIKQFDAATGAYLGTLVAPGDGGLNGPRGLIFRNPGQLFAVNQNVHDPAVEDIRGEILRYNAQTGKPLSPVVPTSDPNAPFAPRGMVLKGNVLYVANFEDANGPNGEVKKYNANSGKFLGDLFPTDLLEHEQFNPRGVVFGPDGQLYVTANQQSDFVPNNNNPLGGFIVKFDTTTGASKVLASDHIIPSVPGSTVVNDLHRPEGIVFSPDGKSLYIASFRADSSDTDKILVLDPSTGAQKAEINLDQVGQPRAFAQAILFGPGGQLFVPISGNGPDTGSVREYNVDTTSYKVFVASGGLLEMGWYLTFGKTNPATLSYNTKKDSETSDGTSDGDPNSAANLATQLVITPQAVLNGDEDSVLDVGVSSVTRPGKLIKRHDTQRIG